MEQLIAISPHAEFWTASKTPQSRPLIWIFPTLTFAPSSMSIIDSLTSSEGKLLPYNYLVESKNQILKLYFNRYECPFSKNYGTAKQDIQN